MGDGVDIENFIYLSVFRVRRRLFAARPRWADTPAPGVFRQRVDQLLGFRDDPSLRRQAEIRGQPQGSRQLRGHQGGPPCTTPEVPASPSRGQLSSSASSISTRSEEGEGAMAPYRVPGSPGEFEPGDSSTPGSAPGSHSPLDMFQDSVEESTLLPDGLSSLSMDTAPGDQYGPGYEGELMTFLD